MSGGRAERQPVRHGCAKVPVVMQMEALECGAACLAMVLAYYGKWLPLEQVRTDCGVSRDGSNAGNMAAAAERYGLAVKGYRFEPQSLAEKGTFPCILHWNFNHFVVLRGFKGNKALINDPARGAVSVSLDELDRSFTGVCLLFEPTEDFAPEGRPESILSFVRKRLKGTATSMAFVLLTTVAISVIGIINPAFSRIFMDRLLSGRDLEWLDLFIACMSGVAALQLVVLSLRAVNLLKIEGKFAVGSNAVFLWHLLRLPVGFYSQRLAGDLLNRQKVNESIAATLVSQIAPLALGFVMMIFYLAVMLRYSLLLTAIGVSSIVINLLLAQVISKKRINIARVQTRDAGRLAGATVSGISMMETLKAGGAENGFFEKWAGYQAAVNTQNVRYSRIDQSIGALPGLFSAIANIVILSLGVKLTMDGQFTVGMILAFSGFMSSFASPAQELIAAGQSLQELRTNMERTEDVMNYPADVEYGVGGDNRKLTGRISLKHVTFGYSPLAPPLIRDLSLELEPGKSVALVGASGSGKSTVAGLILGLYEPWSGEILYDGRPRAQITREAFTSSVAMVDQDIVLFEDTIANNIRLWDETADNAEVIRAAKDAQIHEDIMKRAGGYDAMLSEGGRDMSGGQRQRLEIARMLAGDPSVAVLDEATSALDAQTEHDVVTALKRRNISYVVVAHRLSAVRGCDEIIVLSHGEAAERGTHDELMRLGGLYAQLVTNA